MVSLLYLLHINIIKLSPPQYPNRPHYMHVNVKFWATAKSEEEVLPNEKSVQAMECTLA